MATPDLLRGPVGATLVRLAVPMLLGVVSIVAFNLADTYFVGQLGPDQLAAVGFTFPVVSLIGSIAQGLGIGVTSIVAASMGRNEKERAAHETTDALLLGVAVVAVVAAVGYFTIDPVFTALGATPETLPYVREYMSVWYLAVVFVIVPQVGNAAIRATGDTKTPSYIMGAAVVVNLVLDPLLIFGYGPFPELGLRGAAIATAVSRGLTFALALYVLHARLGLLRWPSGWPSFVGCVRAVGNIAVPASAARAISPLGIAALTAILAGFSAEAVAGYGVGSRIELLALTFIIALSTVLGPFVGQNFGVGNIDRIRRATRLSFRFSLLFGAGMALVLGLAAKPIAEVFSEDAAVVAVTVDFLRIIPASYTLLGVTLTGATILNALQRPWPAAVLSAIQMLGLLIPLAYLGGRVAETTGALVGVAAAYFLAGGLMWYWVLRELRACEEGRRGRGEACAKTGDAADAVDNAVADPVIGGHQSQHEVLPAR